MGADTEEKIIELGRHKPTVESVIERLQRHVGSIKHITAIVEWDNGFSAVFYDSKDVALLCYDKEVLSRTIYESLSFIPPID